MAALIETYREFLSVDERTPVITLGEGGTPLIHAPRLAEHTGGKVYLKFEGANPTGSFKDRGMTMAVSKAVEAGAKAVMCASTGNTSASAAAYAAHAGIDCIVLIPEGKVALGKLAQVAITGTRVVQIEGNFDDALRMVRHVTEKYPVALVNSINPYRIEGQTTGAFEVVDELGEAPTHQAMPVGNAGNITAYWRGYKRYREAGKSGRLPVMLGFQAAGAAPLVHGETVSNPETIATAIRIGNPASGEFALQARDESGGRIDAVTDEEILHAYRLLASAEGVFCEPASAAGVAGILKMAQHQRFKDDDVIVCILTGHGLKDPQTAISMVQDLPKCDPDGEALADLLGLR